MKKIVIIGPVYPFKGGISHYTGLMYKALDKKYDVTMISYKFQYPKILYKKEQKDFGNDTFKVENTQYLLHTVNPLNWISTAKKINALKPDLVIMQWWHPYFMPCYFFLCKFLKQVKILFVCHNVFPHERFFLDKFVIKLALRQGDYYIVQSGLDAECLQKIIENPNFKQTVHPAYNVFKMQNMSMEAARLKLKISQDEKILLFFGFIRAYKGLQYLIQAMPKIVSRVRNARLLIVGDFKNITEQEKYIELIKQNGMEKKIEVCDGYIPDREVEKYFAACNLVVLPYESATQSGIVQVAYGFEKPVVVTNVGGLPEVVKDGKTGYVVGTKNVEMLADAIINFFTQEKETEFIQNVKKEAYRFSWDRMVEIIEEFLP